MKAVRLHDKLDLRVEEVEPPLAPPAGFANVKVRAAGICGSDLHNFRTGQWISRRPSIAGHEFCGRVTAVGADAGGVSVGDLVAVDSRVACGLCPACRGGRTNVCEALGFVGEVCDGGFAEEAQLPVRLLVRHDPSLLPRVAAMAEPLAVALHAVRRLAAPPGEPVLVVGCGAIGGLAALVLSRLHDGPLLLSERNAARAETVAALTGGTPVELTRNALAGVRPRYGLDASGSPAAIAALLECLGGGGTLALVGLGHGTLALDPALLVEREIALVGCHAFDDELPEAVGMLPALAPALSTACEVLPSLDAVPEAYERLLRAGGAALKTVVEMAD